MDFGFKQLKHVETNLGVAPNTSTMKASLSSLIKNEIFNKPSADGLGNEGNKMSRLSNTRHAD